MPPSPTAGATILVDPVSSLWEISALGIREKYRNERLREHKNPDANPPTNRGNLWLCKLPFNRFSAPGDRSNAISDL
jgi:hypothetical protein